MTRDAIPTQANCIFCKIVAGAIPCHQIYEDEDVLSFLDVGPLSRGHTLVIPKGHWVTLDEVPPRIVGRCGEVAAAVGRTVAQATGAEGWNLLQNNGAAAGQVVMHVHFHVIPRQTGDGLGYRWPAGKLESGDAPALLEAIRSRMRAI